MSIYIPAAFQENDEGTLLRFVEQFPFATFVTSTATGIAVSHVPLMARRHEGALFLRGHLARANGHWRVLDGAPSTAVFHGPHAYVSPTWYATAPAVPTWNYAVVHASGVARIRDEAAFAAEVIEELTARYEGDQPGGWRPEQLPADLHQGLLGAIVAFELRVERLEGKLKLGQNRSVADRLGVADHLEASDDTGARAVGAMMRATVK